MRIELDKQDLGIIINAMSECSFQLSERIKEISPANKLSLKAIDTVISDTDRVKETLLDEMKREHFEELQSKEY
tara:strand:+ start:8118 stop:8339 length:222 start_codon:yes stop_codon:yes gene_type:complete